MPNFDDLLDQLELPQCECLNMATDHTLRHCIEAEQRVNSETYLESDADEELLITLKFMQAVKISAIMIAAVEGDADSAPLPATPAEADLACRSPLHVVVAEPPEKRQPKPISPGYKSRVSWPGKRADDAESSHAAISSCAAPLRLGVLSQRW